MRFHKWLRTIRREEFDSPDRAMIRFIEAMEAGWLRFEDRHRFVALWINTMTKAESGSVRNPAAVFVANLKHAKRTREWYGSDADDDAASRLIRDWDRAHPRDHDPIVKQLANKFTREIAV